MSEIVSRNSENNLANRLIDLSFRSSCIYVLKIKASECYLYCILATASQSLRHYLVDAIVDALETFGKSTFAFRYSSATMRLSQALFFHTGDSLDTASRDNSHTHKM